LRFGDVNFPALATAECFQYLLVRLFQQRGKPFLTNHLFQLSR
jgi:hypothetical protein